MNIFLIVICSLTLSFGAAVGINIQKMSMMEEEKKLEGTKRPPHMQPLWRLGLALIIINAIGDFIFFGLAPQSLLAPLGSLGLGWNIFLAPKFNPDETVTPKIVTATVVIYIGTIMAVLTAADTSPSCDLQKIIGFTANWQFHIYFLVCILFMCTLAYRGNRRGYFDILYYCGMAGCLGGQCVLFAKISSELLEHAIMTGVIDDFTTSFLPYIFILCMIITVVTQIGYLNTGLANFDALVVVPVYQCFWNAFGITSGLVFFQEYQYMTARDGVLYTLGICISLKGIAMLVE